MGSPIYGAGHVLWLLGCYARPDSYCVSRPLSDSGREVRYRRAMGDLLNSPASTARSPAAAPAAEQVAENLRQRFLTRSPWLVFRMRSCHMRVADCPNGTNSALKQVGQGCDDAGCSGWGMPVHYCHRQYGVWMMMMLPSQSSLHTHPYGDANNRFGIASSVIDGNRRAPTTSLLYSVESLRTASAMLPSCSAIPHAPILANAGTRALHCAHHQLLSSLSAGGSIQRGQIIIIMAKEGKTLQLGIPRTDNTDHHGRRREGGLLFPASTRCPSIQCPCPPSKSGAAPPLSSAGRGRGSTQQWWLPAALLASRPWALAPQPMMEVPRSSDSDDVNPPPSSSSQHPHQPNLFNHISVS